MTLAFVMLNRMLFVALFVLLFLIIADPIKRHLSGITQLSVMGLTRLLTDESAVLIVVSEPAEYNKGHTPNSENIPVGKMKEETGRLEKWKSKHVVLVCRSGNRSNKSAFQLKKMQFENIYNLEGGLIAWEKENLPIERS